MGSYCTIGSVQFNFTGYEAYNATQGGLLDPLSPSQVRFTPVIVDADTSGFRLDFSMEAQSAAPRDPSVVPQDRSPVANAETFQENYARLFYGVSTVSPITKLYQEGSDSIAFSSATGGYSVAFTMTYSCAVGETVCYEAYTGNEIGQSSGWSIHQTPTMFYRTYTDMNGWTLMYTWAELGSGAQLYSASTYYSVINPVPAPGVFSLMLLSAVGLFASTKKDPR